MGNIQKRGNGSYLLSVQVGAKQGKKIRKTKTVKAKNKAEAMQKLAEFEREIETGTYIDSSKMTLEEFLELWLEEHVQRRLSPTTASNYRKLIESRINKQIGHIKLQQLQPIQIIKFYNYLEEKTSLGMSSILKYHRILSSALQDSVQWQLRYDNPCRRVKAPTAKRKKAKFYDLEKVLRLFTFLDNEKLKFRLITYISVTTGMRRGEILALKWSDFNSEYKNINVENNLVYVAKKGQIKKQTKNEEERKLVLPDFVSKLLKNYKTEQNIQKIKKAHIWEDDYVFTQWNGKPMHVDSVSNWFSKFIEKNNLPYINFHGMRHTAASLLLHSGITFTQLSEILGHKDKTTTMNIYSHMIAGSEQKAADIMQNLLFTQGNGQQLDNKTGD